MFRLSKVTSGLAVGIWVGFGLTLGLKKTAENNPKTNGLRLVPPLGKLKLLIIVVASL